MAAAPSFSRWEWLLAAALVVVIFLVYQPAWQGGFIWDDDVTLLNNPVLQPGGLAKIWVPGSFVNYWPLTCSVYRFEFEMWGLKPIGFHLVNILLHALSALLVWRILTHLRVPGAMFVAALFALHPVNVESVAWITQLKNVLSLPLTLLSVLFYLHYEKRGERWRYAVAVSLFFLSTLAKGMALTLPVVLLACAWWQRGSIRKQDLLRVVPYILIGAIMARIEVWSQHPFADQPVVRSDSLLSRTAVAGCAVWFYLWKLIWPAKLIFVYPTWSIDERNVLSYLPGVLLVVILALAWRQRHSWGRPVVMLIVCYVGLLLPVLGFVNINFMAYSLVADHWQYAAMIVPCAVFAGVAATLARRRFFPPPAAFVLCLALLATLGTLTWRQSRMYADIDALYQTTIDRNPSCWMVYNNLGLLVMHRGRTDEAMSYYQKALQIKPDHVYALNNLGNVLASRGQWDEAIAYYRKALSIEPNYAMGHNNLGNILVHLGQLDEGRAQYQRALEIDPTCWNAHCNMGDLAAGLGCFEEALAHYRRAAEILPNDASTLGNLGAALAATGQFDEAVAQCRKALEIKPDDVEIRYQLGVALAGQGRFPEALTQYREALKINPKHARVHSSLAWLRATCPQAAFRNGVEAVEHAQRASQLCGGMRPEVLNALAAAYAEAGWFPEALATARKALELARQQNNHALAEALQERIARYETGKPYRQPLSSPASRSRKP